MTQRPSAKFIFSSHSYFLVGWWLMICESLWSWLMVLGGVCAWWLMFSKGVQRLQGFGGGLSLDFWLLQSTLAKLVLWFEKSFSEKKVVMEEMEWEKWKLMMNTSLEVPGALAHRLQRHTACNAALPEKSKTAARGPQNGWRGLVRCLPLGFWVLPSTFAK